MSVERLAPLLGISIDPSAADPQEPIRRARLADDHGLDLISVMDHPYNRKLFDSWTLLTVMAANTERVRVGTNVLNLPLRSPAMLAKMAASLDLLSGGRLELGLGAGAVWDGIVAFGGPRRSPGEAFRSFKEALEILRGMWDHAGASFSYDGDFYKVKGAKPGPAPAHPIPIWVGGYGPRMLRLTGRQADGVIVSYNYLPPEKLSELNRRIDAGAEEAGRDPAEIRRGYNLMGVIDLGRDDTGGSGLSDDYLKGTPDDWVAAISGFYYEYSMDTFNFWPVAGNQRLQIETFAREIAPAVREAVA